MAKVRDATHMAVAYVWRKESTCTRGQVGAVLVVDGRQIASGFNGAPPGSPHCTEVGCDLGAGEEAGCQRSIHAEANVIAFAARHGVPTLGATLYSTACPCLKCAQLVLSAGIREVVYAIPYRLRDGETLLIESGVTVRRLPTAMQRKIEGDDDVWYPIPR